jgi:hypothetical protein
VGLGAIRNCGWAAGIVSTVAEGGVWRGVAWGRMRIVDALCDEGDGTSSDCCAHAKEADHTITKEANPNTCKAKVYVPVFIT